MGRVSVLWRNKADSLRQKLIFEAQQISSGTSKWNILIKDFRRFLFSIRGTSLNGLKLITEFWSKLSSLAQK